MQIFSTILTCIARISITRFFGCHNFRVNWGLFFYTEAANSYFWMWKSIFFFWSDYAPNWILRMAKNPFWPLYPLSLLAPDHTETVSTILLSIRFDQWTNIANLSSKQKYVVQNQCIFWAFRALWAYKKVS